MVTEYCMPDCWSFTREDGFICTVHLGRLCRVDTRARAEALVAIDSQMLQAGERVMHEAQRRAHLSIAASEVHYLDGAR